MLMDKYVHRTERSLNAKFKTTKIFSIAHLLTSRETNVNTF